MVNGTRLRTYSLNISRLDRVRGAISGRVEAYSAVIIGLFCVHESVAPQAQISIAMFGGVGLISCLPGLEIRGFAPDGPARDGGFCRF